MGIKKKVKEFLELLEPIFETIESLYKKIFDSDDYTNKEAFDEWQTLSFDNSINSKIRSSQGSLGKYSLILFSENNKESLEKINDILLVKGYETQFLSIESEKSYEILDNMSQKDGFLFIYSPIDLDLDLIKNSFKDKCRIFIFSHEKLNLRYRLSKSGNEILENPESMIESDIIVFSSENLSNNINEAFVEIYNATRGNVPIKILYKLMMEYLAQISNNEKELSEISDNFDVEYSTKGSCNRLISDYVTGLY